MGQVAWVVENMYLNVFIYKTFNASAADISYMVAASAVSATLTTVFIGALSDKIGKRKFFICSGYILWGISIFSFVLLKEDIISKLFGMTVSAASLGVTLTIVLDCVMTFFGSSANDAAFNAWITDSTDSSSRGAAEGINAMMPLVSVLVVFGGFMFFDLNEPASWTWIFSIIGVLTLLIGVLGIFIIKEPVIEKSQIPYIQGIFYGFRPSTVKANPILYVTLFAFIIFNISIQIFMPYLIIYYEVSLKMTDYVLVMAPAIILASVITAFWGKLYDKKGFAFSGTGSLVMLIIGYIILFFVRTTVPVFIGSLLMMGGYLASVAVFGAMIRDNTPSGKVGVLQGVRIFSQVLIPGVVGPYIGKTILRDAEVITNNDGTVSFVPNEKIFLAAAIAAVLVFFVFFAVKKLQKPRTVRLKTEYEKELEKKDIPFDEYPRPMMRRDSYICLNGKWSFTVEENGKNVYSGEINVPFVPESELSGVGRKIKKNEIMTYERKFILNDLNGKRAILHFGAVDQHAQISINGECIYENIGGYLPFEIDITDHVILGGENILTVKAWDKRDLDLPYGKQTDKRGGMWYTNISGIWQTVWLEAVAEKHIGSVKVTPDLTGVDIEVKGGESEKTLIFNGERYTFKSDKFRLEVKDPILWSPEVPHLYTFDIECGEDKISSYFGLRTVGVEKKNGKSFITLNGKPYFFHGLLDQGYFSDGIFLPATEQGFKDDILTMKKCGFNMLRKHIKLEPELFYYYCDKFGMIVFQDMINSGKYSFIIDTALPTAFLKKGINHHASRARKENYEKTSYGIIDRLYNHPSVVYYTVFNEGWGQFDGDKYYELFKKYDNTRIYDTASGWFKTKHSDVESDHVYFKPVKPKRTDKPLILSEFGGYSCKISGHAFNLDETYGYRYFSEKEKFQEALIELYTKEIIPAIESGLCGTVLTQVSDVEDETNGLLTYDRAVLKVDCEKMSAMSGKLYDAFEKTSR